MLNHDNKTNKRHMTREKIDGLETWVNAFFRDRKTSGLSAFTVEYYCAQLHIFTIYCKPKKHK